VSDEGIDTPAPPRKSRAAMRIFDRYIARQIIIATVLSVGVLSAVLVLGQVFKKLLDLLVEGVLPPSALLKFMAYAFPASLSYTLPWGLLTAVLLTFGRLSADNELLSLRSAGMSLSRICLPVFLVAGAFSLLCLWINTVVAPGSQRELNAMTRQAVVRDPRVLFVPDKVVDRLPGYLFYVEDRTGDNLRNVQIIQLQENAKGGKGLPSGMIFAKEGRITTEGLAERRMIEFGASGNTWFVRREPAPLTDDERTELSPEQIAVREEKLLRSAVSPPGIFDFSTESSGIPLGIKSLLDSASSVKADWLSMEEVKAAIDDPAILNRPNPDAARSEARTEYHRRYSFSLACLVLALVAVPFGITAHRRETSAGFVFSLIVGIAYFSLIMLGSLWKTKPEKLPHLMIWLPNIVFGILGIILFRRLARR
jgi:lipopolysaccharide export LptBFGC system permease protein LptF